MRSRPWFLILSSALAVVLSGISCYDDDYWDDDDDYYCHYDQNGFWHCHDADDDDYHGRGQTDGLVIVLITDHPRGDVSAFYVTITEVTLFDADTGPVSVYRSETGWRLDLLSLRGPPGARLHELLAVREIPPGVYDAIRLTVRDPVVVLSSGIELAGPEIDLSGNGHVEIDLAEPVLLGPDETVHLILDIDAHASIAPAALSERWSVRPLVLVDVLYTDIDEEFGTRTGVEGELRERDPESGRFQLELPEDRGELQVRVLQDAEILDRDFDPAPPGVLTAGSQVIARGVLRSTGEVEIERIAVDPGPGRRLPPGEPERSAASLTAPIEGTVSGVAPQDRTLDVDVAGTQRTIAVSPDTTIVAVEITEEGLWQTSIPLRQVEIGAEVAVHGDSGSPARLVRVIVSN